MLLTFHSALRKLNTEPSIGASHEISRPYLLTDQNGMSKSHRGPSIDASYHVSVHLAKLFQSRRFLEIDQKQEWPVVAMFVNGSRRNEYSL